MGEVPPFLQSWIIHQNIFHSTTIIDYDIKYQSAISHGLKSMNGKVRNTLFGNPATQLAGVMFTSTHKEPGKRQFVWICINLNKGRRKSARILLGLEVNIWLIYSFIDPVLVQPKQSKARWWNIFQIYMDLLPFSAMLVISFLSSLLSTTSLWGTLGEAGWLLWSLITPGYGGVWPDLFVFGVILYTTRRL